MNITQKEYDKLSKKMSPPSPKLKNCVMAFLVGGAICMGGQLLFFLFENLGFNKETSSCLVSVVIIFLTAVFTGIGLFDKLAKHAGAGTLVPVTGFANSVVSPAIEFKSEGFVLGVGANMFKIAGPVIAYGVVASVVYGLIYWIMKMI